MKPASFLLVSDIHFGLYARHSDFTVNHTPPKSNISNAVPMKADLIKKLLGRNITGILALGDLTSIGSPAEFIGCTQVLREIAEALSIRAENVFSIYGNHDVHWPIAKLADTNNDTGFHHVAASLGSLFSPNAAPVNSGPVLGAAVFERDEYVLFMLNSGYFSVHDQEYPHGRLGSEQLEWLKEVIPKYHADSKWNILGLHHHPRNYPYPMPVPDISTLEEGAELLEFTGKNGIDLICHGHRHHPRLYTYLETGWPKPQTSFCAGSLAVDAEHRHNGEIPNTCHIITLEGRAASKAALGYLETFQYSAQAGWVPARYSLSLPLDGKQKFGYLAAKVELEQMAEEMVAAALSGGTANKLLPAHGALPPEMQCVNLEELNKLFADACRKLDHEIVGKYPDPVAVYNK